MIDKAKAESAVRLLLEALGEDVESPGLVETPARVVRMYEEVLAGREVDPATHLSKVFPLEDPGFVLERDISFHSLCEHHLLPFFGKVHIAYLPKDKVTGLSKLARTVETYARRLQLQERMTQQICQAIQTTLNPEGVLVVAEAEHFCMSMRGIRKPGTTTVTLAATGAFEDPLAQKTIMDLIRL